MHLQELDYAKSLVAVKVRINGKVRWSVLQGIYMSKSEAQQVADKIANANSDLRPWVRQLAELRKVLVTKATHSGSAAQIQID